MAPNDMLRPPKNLLTGEHDRLRTGRMVCRIVVSLPAVMGRTLLQDAVPTSFGLKAAGWMLAIDEAREEVSSVPLVVQMGGPVGHRDPAVAASGSTVMVVWSGAGPDDDDGVYATTVTGTVAETVVSPASMNTSKVTVFPSLLRSASMA